MNITLPDIGSRIWTIEELKQHGPFDGPKTDVPANIGGTVVGTERPYYTMDNLLYIVKWDSGQQTKHYLSELFVIGPFQTLDEFDESLKYGKNAKLVVGPQGGFREFSMSLNYSTMARSIKLYKEQRGIWLWLEQALKKHGIEVEIERLPSKPRQPRR